MDLEQIVQQILLVRRDLSRKEILNKIYEKKRSAEDYYLDEVAARIVASELGVEIPREAEELKLQLTISDLISGLNDVTVTGRVILLYPGKTFRRSDLTEGKIVRLLIGDKTGTLTVVLWDDKTVHVESGEISSGQILRILHGYVREGLNGKLELHVGQRGDVQVSPSDVAENTYPSIASFIDKISRLTTKRRRANVSGVIQEVYQASEFKRKDGTNGKVRRLRLKDATGQTTVVFWNQKVDELGDVKKGDHLRIMNARLKKRGEDILELHVETATQIEILAKGEASTPIPALQLELNLGAKGTLTPNPTLADAETPLSLLEETAIKISDIKDEGVLFTIEGTVATHPITREIITLRNEKVKVTSFDLTDQTGRIRVSLWRKLAEVVKDLTVGTQIQIQNGYAKKGFSNLIELVSNRSTTVKILPKQEAQTKNQDSA